MIDTNIIKKINHSSIEERIQIMELILQSLKNEIKPQHKTEKKHFKPFKIRKFSLGQEVHVDRDELYAERGL